MKHTLRTLLFSFVVMLILAIPSVSLAAGCVGGSVSSYNSTGGFTFGASSGSGCSFFGAGGFISNPFGLPSGSISGIIANIAFWLLGIFGFLGVIGFVVSGIMYLISAGDDDMIDRAKTGMLYSIVGVIVGLIGLVVMQAVSALLSGVSTTF